MEYTIHTLSERPELLPQIERLSEASWPRFLLQGVSGWDLLYGDFAKYQILLCDKMGQLIGVGHTVPFYWNNDIADLPETIEEIIARAVSCKNSNIKPNVFSALAAMVHSESRGKYMSSAILLEMKSLAKNYNCQGLLAPVRPTRKADFPLIDMDEYIQWRRADGSLFDPWLRVHQNLGASGLAVAKSTMTVTGTIEEWAAWTGQEFPGSGHYIVDGALQPVAIDQDSNSGVYHDPNYWMLHPINPTGAA